MNICPMCFEVRPMRISGPCGHVFCQECLGTQIGCQPSESVAFPCPSCKTDCPLPSNGVQGLRKVVAADGDKGHSQEGVVVGNTEDVQVVLQNEEDGLTTAPKCNICQSRGRSVKAVNTCVECDDVNMCLQCTKDHNNNSSLGRHVFLRVRKRPQQGVQVCTEHGKRFVYYCMTCHLSVCCACILLKHREHRIEKVDCAITENLSEIKVVIQTEQCHLADLSLLQQDMTSARDALQALADCTIKQIEDRAEESIGRIQDEKADLKARVKRACDLTDMDKQLKKFPDITQNIGRALRKSEQLLKNATLDDVVVLPRQTKTKTELLQLVDELGKELDSTSISDDINRGAQQNLALLSIPSFVPDKGDSLYLGVLEDPLFRTCDFAKAHNVQDDIIRCVAILGNTYALGLSVNGSANQRDSIEIYEFPKFCVRSLQCRFIDIAGTPSGNLAVLSPGGADDCVRLRLFTSRGDRISCGGDTQLPSYPTCLSVGLSGHYHILSVRHGQCEQARLTLLAATGEVLSTTLLFAASSLGGMGNEYLGLACGGRFTFVSVPFPSMSTVTVYVYEVREGRLLCVGSENFLIDFDLDGSNSYSICATLNDDLYMVEAEVRQEKQRRGRNSDTCAAVRRTGRLRLLKWFEKGKPLSVEVLSTCISDHTNDFWPVVADIGRGIAIIGCESRCLAYRLRP